ncbi:hypothetical protein AOZ07_11420 [Glutamicibacter halophytocola]|uniref:hypothetical protein n=1 Tax=Glutamicibacter halophytocola TaxID=1933880 RepID=UPI0006D4BAA3|nr:hypothetical protein [Glutamicibacter halophytocola]ALG29527.1 hypothetical protein AOZ07_11420 [Glutamicibacter halophytocola]
MAQSTLSAPALGIPELDINDLLTVRQVSDLGYGHRQTICARINDGTLPAVRVGNRFEIRRGDLHLLAKPVQAADEDRLDVYVKGIVDNFPKLNAEQKSQLGHLLAPAP